MSNDVKRRKNPVVKILKWTGIVLLALILLLALVPIVFKDKIVAIVKEQANNNLNAKVDFGDFDLSLISSFPDFRFKIDNLSVIGVDSFATDTLAIIAHLKTDINLKSVLNGGPYQINSIVIDNPRILAKVLKSGRANWDIAKPSTDTTAVEEPAAESDTSATKFSVSLKEFRIKDAYITYDDQQGGMYAHINDLDYDMEGDFTQDNFTMENLIEIAGLTFKMGGVPYASNVKTRIKADLDMDMPNMKFTFKENEIGLNDLTLGFDGYVQMPDTNIDLDIKFQTKKTDFKAILSLIPAVYSREFASVQTSGKLSLDGNAKGRYNASSLPAFAVNLGIANAMFKYPSLPKAVDNINVDIKVRNPNGDLDATTVDVNQFHVELAGNPVDLSAKVRTPISDPGITAGLKGMIDLTSIKDVIPLEKGSDLSGVIKSDIAIDGHMSAIEKQEFEKFKASGALEIDKMDYKSDSLPYEVKLNTMKLVFSTQFVELAAFDALLGKSDIRASGRIENFMPYVFKDDLLKGSFSVMSAMIDLNELMGPSTTTTATPEQAEAPADTTSMSVFPVPSNVDFNLNAKVARILYTNMEIANLNGNIVIRNQKVDMTNLSMVIIGGNLTINGFYETTNIKKPSVGLSLKMENFDIQRAFTTFNTIQKIAPAGQYAKGTFTATLENFRTTLNEKMEPDLGSVNARGIFRTNKVSISGVPSLVKLGDALKMDKLKNLEMNNINVNYQIKDGRIHLDPFETKIAGIPTKIEGSTGLDQTLDYRYQMEIPRSMLGGAASDAITGLLNKANQKAGTNMALGEKIHVNALIKGTVTKPVVETGLKEEANKAVSTVTTQALNTAIDKANEEAQKILDDARKQVERIKAETQVLADKTRQEGYAQADQLVEQASNPLAKAAAKKAAEVAKKKTDEKVQKMVAESDARCQKILDDAKAKADAKAAEGKR